MSKEFNRNDAWVTGGTRGIGKAIASSLESIGINVSAFGSADFDLESQEDRTLFLMNERNRPGILVLNAGINNPEKFENLEISEFLRIMEVNLMANIDILKSTLPAMKENNFGRIVLISSLYSSIAKTGRSAYSVSKAAAEALIRSIAVEYSEYGILANVVSPGFVDTELTTRNNTFAQIEEIKSRIPLGRLADPIEIAELVKFLASEKNSYINGQTFRIDGGVSITC